MNEIRDLMQTDTFTSREFNKKLNEKIEHGWNGKVTLDFLYVAEFLGMVECLGTGRGNQYSWRIVQENGHGEDKFNKIKTWIDAYPLDIFPEPDFKKAHEVLKANGITLDAISASNMRHVLNGIKDIIES